VFDTETTGLTLHPDAEHNKQPRCIEFGAVLLSSETGEILEERSQLINPGEALEAIITKITGITDADLKDAPSFAQVAHDIAAMFGRAGTMMAHNLPFDKAIIRGELARLPSMEFPWPENGICTVGLFKDEWGRNPKLTELYEELMGKPLPQTHRALDDVRAMVEFIQQEKLWRLA
jgi:DNA polymerase-3 subunit epsilon